MVPSEDRVGPRACPVCGAPASWTGSRVSPLTGSTFALDRCSSCSFVFVRDPRTDFGALYGADYYEGRGADTSVDYVTEMTDPTTIRVYEWRGVVRAVEHLISRSSGSLRSDALISGTRWLDYGCGLGGLVRWVRAQRGCSILGFEEGYAAARLAATGVPFLTRPELEAQRGTFDVVTAIEVLEHSLDPVSTLQEMCDCLRPGGVLFVTTGNAASFRDRLDRWSYTAVPDVHVSFFEPATLELAMRRAGLEPVRGGFLPGMDDIIRFKVLKALGRRRRGGVERVVPWSLVARAVDRRHHVSAMPAARRPVSRDH